MGSGQHLEVIGLDPDQALAGTYVMAALPRPGIFAIAVRASGLEALAALARVGTALRMLP